ncbi:hypothetical protein MKY30_20560 [Oceanobacillus sp. FSL W8-0428]|uniref:DUF3679 domain-containing protein n=1 Tax=Oceanobacillus sojae TaxID=582851 RepID=A0A511ZG16_9BACI|nr:hypothetical protein [Oceanobacillus sojae]GEN86396.1 hypothetical protein OSO01_11350 [Oceanobacillus sojae]
MRNIIILLLLVIFFLSGLVFGMQKNETAEQTAIPDESAVEVAEEINEQEQIIITETDVLEEGNYSLTNRTAATMEGIVKGLFEVIVSIMYGIGELFF